ncbi:hypothetical protein [Aeromonas veronii]|uniref:hypothetical protein n=1 Tax=Aeromonas veronii TaxID=654 RepID=UPI002443AA91|nr:hypothetical protein [Aeromonas veronii]
MGAWCERLARLRPDLAHPLLKSAWLYRLWRYAPPQQTATRAQRAPVTTACQTTRPALGSTASECTVKEGGEPPAPPPSGFNQEV